MIPYYTLHIPFAYACHLALMNVWPPTVSEHRTLVACLLTGVLSVGGYGAADTWMDGALMAAWVATFAFGMGTAKRWSRIVQAAAQTIATRHKKLMTGDTMDAAPPLPSGPRDTRDDPDEHDKGVDTDTALAYGLTMSTASLTHLVLDRFITLWPDVRVRLNEPGSWALSATALVALLVLYATVAAPRSRPSLGPVLTVWAFSEAYLRLIYTINDTTTVGFLAAACPLLQISILALLRSLRCCLRPLCASKSGTVPVFVDLSVPPPSPTQHAQRSISKVEAAVSRVVSDVQKKHSAISRPTGDVADDEDDDDLLAVLGDDTPTVAV